MIRSERVRLLISHRDVYYQIAQLQWRREATGEGLFVHFPYFTNSSGVLRTFDLDGPARTTVSINFTQEGVATTEHVKYSHHPDGSAHFSQDGRIVTTIRSQTRPLAEYSGHIFSLYYWNLTGFEVASAKRIPRLGAGDSNVCVGWSQKRGEAREPRRSSGVIHGYLYHGGVEAPDPELDEEDVVRPLDWQMGTLTRKGTVLSPPATHESDYVLGIGCSSSRRYEASRPKFSFFGGFDDHLPATEPHATLRGITLLYGLDDFQDAQQTLRSVDFCGVSNSHY